jgi:uncharacterized protein (TIGR03086 family)
VTGSEADAAAMTNTTTTTDPRALFGQGVQIAGGVIDGVRADQMADPTPCDDFDVRGLLHHLLHVLDRVAVIGRGEDPFSAPVVPLPSDDEWLAEWRAAADRARAVWSDDAVLERTIVLPWSQVSGGETLLGYLNEIIVHTWDLATATQQPLVVPDEIVEAAFSAIRQTLPGGERSAFFAEFAKDFPGFDAPFADQVATPADAPLLDQLVAWNGRQP